MSNAKSGNRFSTEVRSRAVRLVLENEADYTRTPELALCLSAGASQKVTVLFFM